jgi:hypothetical protein
MTAADRLARILEEAPTSLAAISEAEAGRRQIEGKWCRKEILGHLIDSASNNHQRLLRAQFAAHLEFPSYQQELWVAAQSYVSAPWPDLVSLWSLYNRHLLRVIRAIPDDAMEHTLSLGGQPMTLAAVIDGYVDHLEHHLAQI